MSRKQTKALAHPGGHQTGHRSWEARLIPYAIPHGLVALDLAAGLAAHAAWGGDAVWTPITSLAMSLGTAGLGALAYRIGKVREQVVRWHTAATVGLAGAGMTLTTIIGPNPTWLQVAGGVGVLAGFTWNLRRLDSLRHDTGASQAEQDTWAAQLGLGNVKPGKAKQIGARLEVPLRHGVGDTVKTVQNALPAIEAAIPGLPPGRSRVIENHDDASRSTLVLVTEDVLKDTISWPGPMNPGQSIAEPIASGVYEDDQMATIALPGVPNWAPSNVGYMGMTRAGKTICALINTADMLTRRDVVVWWGDLTKGEQTAGPVRDGLDVYADTPARAKAMLRSLKEVVRARADALGKAGYRQWEPKCFTDPRLKMPYLVAHFEEADEIMTANPGEFIWLTGKALSTGVAVSVSLQRADHVSMPTTARANIGTWYCFGVGDDYSAGFALSQPTIDAGAHPEKWKNRKQGYFYLEAPGVAEERFPVPAKAFFATDAELSAVIAEWAPVRAHLDDISARAAGDFYTSMKGTQPVTSTNTPRNAPAVDEDLAELAEEVAAEMPDQPGDELLDGHTNPGEPIPAWTGTDMQFGSKPEAVSQAQAEQAFDELLAAMAGEGIAEFQVDDLVKRYPYRQRPWASKRLSRMASGELVLPGGLTLERLEAAGRYRLDRLGELVAAGHGQ